MKGRVGCLFMSAIIVISTAQAFAQDMAKRLTYGINGGSQRLVTSDRRAGIGYGAEGHIGYRITNRFGATASAGFATLPFNFRTAQALESNLIYGNILFDYELANNGAIHPYIMFGVGGLNYQGFRIDGTKAKRRRNSGSGIVGLGLRYFLSPTSAFNISGAYHLTGSEAIDSGRGKQDAFVSARVGLTFFGQSADASDDDFFAELTPTPEQSQSSDYYGFSSELVEPAEESSAGDIQDYVRLQSQVDELSQEIDNKEREVSSLQGAITAKREQASDLQAAPAPRRTSTIIASFSRAYEDALNSFYLKRYRESIEKFDILIDEFPNHALASNCHYWKGEAHFGAGNFTAAIDAFNNVLSFAKSLKKDDALLMLGRCYDELNRKEDAQQAFNRLIREYPGSEYVVKAEEYLNKI